jgi:hypothetical protein
MAPWGHAKCADNLTYGLDQRDGGRRVTLRHEGFTADTCTNTAIGWQTSFARLAKALAP